jgi:hypothetical protein
VNPSEILYPEENFFLADRQTLEQLLTMASAQRAWSAYRLLELVEDESLSSAQLRFAAIEAFALEVQASEDILSWFLAIYRWIPGTLERSLFYNRDHVKIEKNEENRILRLLECNDDEFRKRMHIPSEYQLTRCGFSEDLITDVMRSSAAWRDGLRRTVLFRQELDRARVRAFNKYKHSLLVFDVSAEGPTSRITFPSMDVAQDRLSANLRSSVNIDVTRETVRIMASRSIAAQVFLFEVATTLLRFRFNREPQIPVWARLALELPGWRTDRD